MDYFAKNIEILKSQLESGDEIESAIQVNVAAQFMGQLTYKIGALALTKKHLIFQGGGSFFGYQNITFPVAQITAINLKTEHIRGSALIKGTMISVFHGGGVQRYSTNRTPKVEDFVAQVAAKIGTPDSKIRSNSFVDELRNLKELFDAGVLNEAEFQSGKQKLLE
jgi:hypothetical protein